MCVEITLAMVLAKTITAAPPAAYAYLRGWVIGVDERVRWGVDERVCQRCR